MAQTKKQTSSRKSFMSPAPFWWKPINAVLSPEAAAASARCRTGQHGADLSPDRLGTSQACLDLGLGLPAFAAKMRRDTRTERANLSIDYRFDYRLTFTLYRRHPAGLF